MTTLNNILPRQGCRIVSIGSQDTLAPRLMAMGMLPGSQVHVVGVAPLGDPMMIQLDGCRLSLRRAEAQALTVEPFDVLTTEPN